MQRSLLLAIASAPPRRNLRLAPSLCHKDLQGRFQSHLLVALVHQMNSNGSSASLHQHPDWFQRDQCRCYSVPISEFDGSIFRAEFRGTAFQPTGEPRPKRPKGLVLLAESLQSFISFDLIGAGCTRNPSQYLELALS